MTLSAMLRLSFLACSLCLVAAVTPDSSDPTDDSNYMIMQGDFNYVAPPRPSFGTISARAQMVRSALTASTKFAIAMKIETAAQGAQFDFVLRRHRCDVPSDTVYQDPYQCPNYNPILDFNDCGAQPANSNVPIEMSMSCKVDANQACVAEFDWAIYLPEEYQGQKIDRFSIGASTGGADVACADLIFSRDTMIASVVNSADSSGNKGEVALGGLQKDELGYTHVSFVAFSLTPSFTYGARIEDGPCDATFSNSPVAGLSTTFTTSDSGVSSEVSFFTDSIVSPGAESLVITDCLAAGGGPDASGGCNGGQPTVICYDLDVVNPEARTGGPEEIQESERAPSSPSSCDAWGQLYDGPESSKKYSKDAKKMGKYFSFGDFENRNVNGVERCCMSTQFDQIQAREADHTAKMSGLTGRHRAGDVAPGSAIAGLGAGVAGAIVLAAGFVLHIRRVRSQFVEIEISESTPLSSAM